MKKSTRNIIISLAIILLAIIIFLGRFFIKMKLEIKKFTQIKTMEIIPNIFTIKDDFVNMYLLKSNDQFIAIDAAINEKKIKEELNKLKINPDSVAAILLTHTDGDHVGSIKLFKNAEVYISKEEETMINGSTARFYFFHNKLESKYKTINNGEELKIAGFNIKCKLTPGHTPGSLVYIINNEHFFTGDTLSLKNGKASTFNDFFNMDTKEQEKSISELKKIKNIKYIFTAHHGFSDKANRAF